jgi:hypothetical protein
VTAVLREYIQLLQERREEDQKQCGPHGCCNLPGLPPLPCDAPRSTSP